MPTIEDYRDRPYEPVEWEDRVVDESTGDVLVPGTPVNEVNLGRIESGIMRALYDLGLANAESIQIAAAVAGEVDKYRRQRLLQGQAIITSSGGKYFRDSDPHVLVSLPTGSLPQINAPSYDVQLSVLDADDFGSIGELIVYEKAQNGFKVRMTGTATSVVFMWTLLNPRSR